MHSKIRSEEKEKPVSVLHGDEKFLTKILSRNSSADGSFSDYSGYPKTRGNVPFRWETMPGTPRNPNSREDMISELSKDLKPAVRPPPLVESSGLSEPRFTIKQGILGQPKSCFWRKKIWKRKKKIHQAAKKSENFQFYNSPADFLPSASSICNLSSLQSQSSSLSSCYQLNGTKKSSNLKVLAQKIVNWAF